MTNSITVLPEDALNRELVSLLAPRDWRNPQAAGRYKLVVLGGGTAGLVSAAGAAGLGAKVALIERHLLGGDCLVTGCVPSKSLLAAARAAHDARHAERFGVRLPGPVAVDFAAVMQRMRAQRTAIAPHDSARRFTELGVDVYLGAACFTGRDTLEVGGQTLRFTRAIIATGARAALPPIPGLAETGCLTNESVFTLTELPRRLAVLGGGPIGCELAQAFARFGSEVTLIEQGPTVLGREDPDAAALVQAALAADGVRLIFGARLAAVQNGPTGKRLELVRNGTTESLESDEILVGVGRAPNIENLGLQAAGVEHDAHGLVVTDRLATANPRIFAAGDVCSRYKFTHAADAMARIALQNALFFGRKRVSELVLPWCTYTDPELAHTGLTAALAAERGLATESFTVELSGVDRARLEGETAGFVRVLAQRGSGRILGGTIVARHAGELISELTLAITSGATLATLGSTIHPYPTVAEALKRTGDLYQRTRLTPSVQGWMRRWFRWRR